MITLKHYALQILILTTRLLVALKNLGSEGGICSISTQCCDPGAICDVSLLCISQLQATSTKGWNLHQCERFPYTRPFEKACQNNKADRTNRPSSQTAFRRRIRPSSQAVFPRSSDRLLIQVWYLRKTLLGPHQRLQSVSFHNSVTVSFAIPIHDIHLQTFEIPVITSQ